MALNRIHGFSRNAILFIPSGLGNKKGEALGLAWK